MDKVYHSKLLNSDEYALLLKARESIHLNRWTSVKVDAKQLHDALMHLDLARLEIEELKKQAELAKERYANLSEGNRSLEDRDVQLDQENQALHKTIDSMLAGMQNHVNREMGHTPPIIKEVKPPTIRMFPVLRGMMSQQNWDMCPHSIPWAYLAPHEKQAMKNHDGQTLERLAQRGGLGPDEIMYVLLDQPYKPMSDPEAVDLLEDYLDTHKICTGCGNVITPPYGSTVQITPLVKSYFCRECTRDANRED